jgi:starch synthase
MQVLFATAEFAPVAVVGGLAAASAGLVHELRRQGVEVTLVLPDYGGLTLAGEERLAIDVPAWAGPASARRGRLEAVGDVVLVDVPGIARTHPYLTPSGHGWADNDHRFFAFSAAVASLYRSFDADVLHLNDWHTATALAHFPELPPTVFTIHTLGYQGTADLGWLRVFPHRPEIFEMWHSCNPVAAAIRLSDLVVAVSPTYAREIRQPAGGFGLDGLLRGRGDAVVGILNGIDTGIWDPQSDAALAAPFSASDLSGKDDCRMALRAELGLEECGGPVVAMVTRLTDQKGVDLVLACVPFLEGMNAQLVVLGAGDVSLATALLAAAEKYPGRVVFRDGYNDALSHRIIAGADLFVMPSRFEPCGLAQMQAMRYGTLPVVTGVGGLCDTVIDLDTEPTRGTGFVASNADALSVLDALHRAVRGWGNRQRRQAARRRGMKTDWSWTVPAAEYIAHYRSLSGTGPK